MHPTTPTSPSFLPPSSPLTPHSPSIILSPLMAEPLAQPIITFSQEGIPMPQQGPATSPNLPIITNPWSVQSLARRSSTAMSICSPQESSTPRSPVIPALYTMRTPDQACFQGSSSPLREDGRKSRMAMRSPHFNRTMTLPLRVNTSMFPNFAPEPMAPISEHQTQTLGSPAFSDCETLVDWSPPSPISLPPVLPIAHRSQPRSPVRSASSITTRSPIRKHFRGKHLGGRRIVAQPPPKYHVTISSCPSSPRTQQRIQQYLYCIEHLRAPLVPLISVTNGLPHPAFPTSLLQYHLLTHEQLDSLAKWYHQVTPPIEETFMYPAWVPAWTGLNDSAANAGTVDLETKRRRWGRFIGLRGCESPSATGPESENPDELVHRMEREWRRALERAEEEDRAWEKSWRGRW